MSFMVHDYLIELTKSIKELKPYKAILFGSYANGTPHEDSDIDLVVVIDKDNIPKTFDERMSNYSTVKKYFKSLHEKVPMDILVYTKAEWNLFLKENNSFGREILKNGKFLI